MSIKGERENCDGNDATQCNFLSLAGKKEEDDDDEEEEEWFQVVVCPCFNDGHGEEEEEGEDGRGGKK